MSEKGFFTVIPYHVLTNSDLPDKAKILYGLISNLINEEGFCFATNGYFAEVLKCSESAISKNINELSETGLINVEVERNEKGTWRKLYLCIEKKQAQKILPRDGKNDKGGLKNCDGGVVKNCETKDNITKYENTNINQVKESFEISKNDVSKNDKEDLTDKLKNKIGRDLVLIFGFEKTDLTYFFESYKKLDLKFIDYVLEILKDPKKHDLLKLSNKKAFFISELKKPIYGEKWAEKLEYERKQADYEKRKDREKENREAYKKSLIELDKNPEMQELKKFLAENNIVRVFVPEIKYEADAYIYFSNFVVEKGIKHTKQMIEDLYLKKAG